MDIKSNSRIRGAYRELMESMAPLVRSREDAFSILWFGIHGWLEPEHSAWKADLCGLLTEKVTGKNISVVHTEAQNNTPYYQEIQTRYAFGKSVNDLGEYWKGLIREEKPFRLKLLLGCLKVYYETIMPYIKNEMVAWFDEYGKPHYPELAPTLKPYREHRARIKSTMQIIETVLGVFALQNKTETEYEEM